MSKDFDIGVSSYTMSSRAEEVKNRVSGDDWCTADEIADVLGISKNNLYRQVNSGVLLAKGTSNARRFKLADDPVPLAQPAKNPLHVATVEPSGNITVITGLTIEEVKCLIRS